MLQQQLRQRDEDLAARSAEIGELKDRVAELEKLRVQQQELLAFKDSELAAAQQRLAETRRAEAAAGAGMAEATSTQAAGQSPATTQAAQPETPPVSNGATPWIWGSLALLGLALLAWLLLRRSRPATAPPRRALDSDALAASMVAARHPGPGETGGRRHLPDVMPADVEEFGVGDTASSELDPASSTASTRPDAPTWHSGRGAKPAPVSTPLAEPPPTPSFAVPEEAATLAPQASATQRLKLASAFVDIGDDQSARQMLRELLDDADPVARLEAARMLRELG